MEAPVIKQLKTFEEENLKLKQMFADLSLGNQALKDVMPEPFKLITISPISPSSTSY